ncbi:unnamed protein product [Litomosoides sigmodontis]|uniref:Uncharacterized protein n=1 Tax=Litomosoides sigmodontis TaxID=42156 RepID=A0A3P6TMQ8_LITSI|nr:unnamed protein product [Litomosoides sigmodontis]
MATSECSITSKKRRGNDDDYQQTSSRRRGVPREIETMSGHVRLRHTLFCSQIQLQAHLACFIRVSGLIFKIKLNPPLIMKKLAERQGGRSGQCLECECLHLCVTARLSVTEGMDKVKKYGEKGGGKTRSEADGGDGERSVCAGRPLQSDFVKILKANLIFYVIRRLPLPLALPLAKFLYCWENFLQAAIWSSQHLTPGNHANREIWQKPSLVVRLLACYLEPTSHNAFMWWLVLRCCF